MINQMRAASTLYTVNTMYKKMATKKMTNKKKWKYDATNVGEIQYNQHHRPVGIGDDSSANHPTRSVKNIEKIRVTWSRDTDSTEIHMDDEEEQSQPKPEPRKRSHDIMKLMHLK